MWKVEHLDLRTKDWQTGSYPRKDGPWQRSVCESGPVCILRSMQ